MYYVYALQSLTDHNWLYIGYSDNLREGFEQHNSGKVKSTKSRKPFKLIYYEAYANEGDARRREKELKTHQQRDILKERLKNSLIK